MPDPTYNPYMQMQTMGAQNPYGTMSAQNQYNTMVTMPEQQLEKMYPNIYHVVNPAVMSQCDALDMTYGTNFIPTNEQVQSMTDNILSNVESKAEETIKNETGMESRQFGFGGRPLLRGLIGILLIRELLRRRHRPFGHFPGYYPGYYPGYFGGGIY